MDSHEHRENSGRQRERLEYIFRYQPVKFDQPYMQECRSGDALHQRIVHIEIGMNILDVIMIFQVFEQLHQ